MLLEGQLSREGLFQFDAPAGQALQVIVEAGEGHRAEVTIRPDEVADPVAEKAEPTTTTPAPAQPPPLRHDERFPFKDALTGISLLVAVAAFVLSLRNARRLRELKLPPR